MLGTLLVATLQAGDIHIPDANAASGSCTNFPWTTSSAEIRYHTLAPATTLGSKPFLIRELAFAPCASGVFSATQCEIRMAHFSGATLTTIFATNLQKDLTVVYSGALKWSYTQDQWSDIGLTAPFAYNGTDNVVVEIRYLGAQGSVTSHADRAVRYRALAQVGAYNALNALALGVAVSAKFRLSYVDTQISGSGSTRPGGTVQLALVSTADPNLPYQAGTSLGAGPIPIDTRTLGLSVDPLLLGCVSGWFASVFQGYAGTLDGSGAGAAKILIPNNAALIGVRLHTAFVTLAASAPSGVKSISNTFTFTIQ